MPQNNFFTGAKCTISFVVKYTHAFLAPMCILGTGHSYLLSDLTIVIITDTVLCVKLGGRRRRIRLIEGYAKFVI